jgi:DNA polymerase I
MNSFYGVFASVFYRFTHKDLGASITAWARHNIKTIIQKLEEEGNHVVYSDTDSIFVCAPISKEISPTKPEKGEELKTWNSAKKELIRFGNELAERFSQDEAVLEFEKGLSVFFSHGAKKRYVGRIIYPEEDMIVRGYETQRSDSFDALTNNMQNMFEMILEGRSEDAVKSVVDLIKAAKRNEIPIEQLILSKTCKGVLLKNGEVDFSKHYANPDSMASVRAAKKRMERNLPFTPGMKVGYIVTNGKVSPMEVEPWDEGQENGGIVKYDGDFYAERLATALGRITEAFEWSSKELLAGNRQANLFSF